MKNIVYSTTRQWNPGDEFILMGVEYLIRKNMGEHNSIILNRNPHTKPNFPNYRSTPIRRFFLRLFYNQAMKKGDYLDNSLSFKTDPMKVDLVVFAGSPEWSGSKTEQLYQLIRERQIQSIF